MAKRTKKAAKAVKRVEIGFRTTQKMHGFLAIQSKKMKVSRSRLLEGLVIHASKNRGILINLVK